MTAAWSAGKARRKLRSGCLGRNWRGRRWTELRLEERAKGDWHKVKMHAAASEHYDEVGVDCRSSANGLARYVANRVRAANRK